MNCEFTDSGWTLFYSYFHKPYYQLTEAQKEILWNGNKHFTGLHDFFKELEDKKISYVIFL